MQKNNNTLKSKIYNEILDSIHKGVFPLDQFLNEKELTQKFNVSKGPIREALIELCNENVLRSIPRVGYQIVQLTEKNIKEAMELRYILESSGFKKTISIMQKDYNGSAALKENFLADLDSLNDEYERQINKGPLAVDQHWAYNIDFHLLLNSLAGNSLMNEILNNTLRLIRRAYMQLYSDTDIVSYISNDLVRHKEIVEHLRKKNFREASEHLKKDILFIRGHLYVLSEDSNVDY